MTQYVTEEGVPLRGDGTPFPGDPRQWTEEERAYLEQYAFAGDLDTSIELELISVVEVTEMDSG